MGNVYLDTSFFFGYIENQGGRREEAEKILKYEQELGSVILTSVLTVNEFCCGVYDRYRGDADCEERVAEAIRRIRRIANVYGLNDDVLRRGARIQSAWGALYGQRGKGRDRKLRWDSLHLATAAELKAVRVYAWDDRWHESPEAELMEVGEVISPALCPQLDL